MLRELTKVIASQSGEVPENWKKANVPHIFKKGKKEDRGNYRPVCLTSIPQKMMEQIFHFLTCGGQEA